jgi:hypothetical protein
MKYTLNTKKFSITLLILCFLIIGEIFFCNTYTNSSTDKIVKNSVIISDKVFDIEQLHKEIIKEEAKHVTKINANNTVVPKNNQGTYPNYNIPLTNEITQYLWDECNKCNIKYELALSVISNESNFNVNATNHNKNGSIDVGLFQINSGNHKWLKKQLNLTDLYNPKQNIKAGLYVLNDLKDKYKNYHKMLISYNMGEGNLKKLISRGIESTGYSRKVLQTKETLEIEGKINN